MPYLQLDINRHYTANDKRRLAAKMSETYAEMMSVDIRRISVAIRELGDGGVWRIVDAGNDPVPVSVMMLDIRQGRSPELRMEVAKALCAHAIEILGLREDRLNVEFTQHSGDEMYHPALGGFGRPTRQINHADRACLIELPQSSLDDLNGSKPSHRPIW